MTQRKEHSWNEWDYKNRRTPIWVMMLTSAFVSFVSCLDAYLDAVGVRPPLVYFSVYRCQPQKGEECRASCSNIMSWDVCEMGSARWGYLSTYNLTTAPPLPPASPRTKCISAYSRNGTERISLDCIYSSLEVNAWCHVLLYSVN
jgi:hypothetical protein